MDNNHRKTALPWKILQVVMFVGSYKYIPYHIMIVLVTSIYKQKMYLIMTLEMLAIHPLPGRQRLVSESGLQAPEPLVLRAVLGSQLVHGWIWYRLPHRGGGIMKNSPRRWDGRCFTSHTGVRKSPILLGDQLHGILELYGHLDEFPL